MTLDHSWTGSDRASDVLKTKVQENDEGLDTRLASAETTLATKADGDHTHGAGGVVVSIVADYASIGTGSTDGELKITADTNTLYVWDSSGSSWEELITTGKGLVSANDTTTKYIEDILDFDSTEFTVTINNEGGNETISIVPTVTTTTIDNIHQKIALEAFYRLLDDGKSVDQDFVTGFVKSNPGYYRMNSHALIHSDADFCRGNVSETTVSTENCLQINGQAFGHKHERKINYGTGAFLFEFEEIGTGIANDNDFLAYLEYYASGSPSTYNMGIAVEFWPGFGSPFVLALTDDGYANYTDSTDSWAYSTDASKAITMNAWADHTDALQIKYDAMQANGPELFVDASSTRNMARCTELEPLSSKPYLFVYALEENPGEGIQLALREAKFNCYLNEKIIAHGTANPDSNYPVETLAFEKYTLSSAPSTVTAYAIIKEYDTDALTDLSMKIATKMTTISSVNEISNQLVITVPASPAHGFEAAENALLVEEIQTTNYETISRKSPHSEQVVDAVSDTTITVDYNSDYGLSNYDYDVIELGGNIHTISLSTIATHGNYKIIKGTATLTGATVDNVLFFTIANNKAAGIVAAAAFFE